MSATRSQKALTGRGDADMNFKLQQLQQVFADYAKEDLCLAFSGGVDSSLLLKIACEAAEKTGSKVYAVTFNTRLHPACDLEIASRVARELHAVHEVISIDELEQEAIRNNPANRCYLCKKQLFTTLKQFAGERNIKRILDGTNEDDMHVYRPGIQALKELGIISPLADLHITKEEVKELAAGYHLSVASRPSTPCMATRLPYNTPIDYGLLEKIAKGEAFLRDLIGGNVRLRLHGDIARIEIDKQSFEIILKNCETITDTLKGYGFQYITFDLEGFRSGSMDIQLHV